MTDSTMRELFVAQIDRTVEANQAVFKEIEQLRKRNDELLEMRGVLLADDTTSQVKQPSSRQDKNLLSLASPFTSKNNGNGEE